MYFSWYKIRSTHLLPSAFVSSFPHVAAPLPAVIAIGAIKQLSKELTQGKLPPAATTIDTHQYHK